MGISISVRVGNLLEVATRVNSCKEIVVPKLRCQIKIPEGTYPLGKKNDRYLPALSKKKQPFGGGRGLPSKIAMLVESVD